MQVDGGSLRSCVAGTWRSKGIWGFYSGMSPPLATTGVLNTMLWGTHFNFVNYLAKGQTPSLQNVMQSAVLSGFCISYVVCPMELVKSRLQALGGAGPRAVLMEIWRSEGIRGLYRGWPAVACVRMSNWSYFGSYEFTQRSLQSISGDSSSKQMNALMAGGLAGISFWFVAFPFDAVKATMMVQPEKLSFFQTANKMYARNGMRSFTRGFLPCIIRAFPANAAAFFGFETTMKYLS